MQEVTLPGLSLFVYTQFEHEYSRTSDVATLPLALEVLQSVDDLFVFDPRYLNNLSRCQRWLFDATRDLIHLDKAINAGRKSVQTAPEPSHFRSLCAADLSNALARRYSAKGARDNKGLQDALTMARVAVAATREDSVYRDFALSTLATRLWEYYGMFGGDSYLEEGIKIGRKLVSKPSDRNAVHLILLGVELNARYGRYRRMEDLMEAKTFLAEALDAFPKGHSNHLHAARPLADCLIRIVEKTKEAHWLDEATGMLIPLEHEAASGE